jgi:hypothetical protein
MSSAAGREGSCAAGAHAACASKAKANASRFTRYFLNSQTWS